MRTAVNDALAHHGVAERDADLIHKLPQHVGRQLAVRARADDQQRVATRLHPAQQIRSHTNRSFSIFPKPVRFNTCLLATQ